MLIIGSAANFVHRQSLFSVFDELTLRPTRLVCNNSQFIIQNSELSATLCVARAAAFAREGPPLASFAGFVPQIRVIARMTFRSPPTVHRA